MAKSKTIILSCTLVFIKTVRMYLPWLHHRCTKFLKCLLAISESLALGPLLIRTFSSQLSLTKSFVRSRAWICGYSEYDIKHLGRFHYAFLRRHGLVYCKWSVKNRADIPVNNLVSNQLPENTVGNKHPKGVIT